MADQDRLIQPPKRRDSEPGVEIGPMRAAAASGDSGAGEPVDHIREAPAIRALKNRGFTGQFIAEGDRLRLSGTDRTYRPEDVRIRDYYRFEGTSDPDDMSVIYAIEANDGTCGTLTDAFGAYADAEVSAMLDRMRVSPPPRAGGRRRILAGTALGAVALGAVAYVVTRLRRAA